MVYQVLQDPIISGDGGPRSRMTSLFVKSVSFYTWLISSTSYWNFLAYLTIVLIVFELTLSPFESIYSSYSDLIGYVGLAVEAMLPLPQLMANARSRSCKGFRFSLLASWIIGDAMKMYWFFTSESEIPWSFKLCGMFQAFCDLMLGVQYLVYGDRPTPTIQQSAWPYAGVKPHVSRFSSGGSTSSGRTTPFSEKAF